MSEILERQKIGAERIRMALAEAGYPDADVDVFTVLGEDDPQIGVRIAKVTTKGEPLPMRAAWMAYKIAGSTGVCCWECFKEVTYGQSASTIGCLSAGQGLEDCGKER